MNIQTSKAQTSLHSVLEQGPRRWGAEEPRDRKNDEQQAYKALFYESQMGYEHREIGDNTSTATATYVDG
jgi:hypothetical protein